LCRKKGEIELGELLLTAHHAVPLGMVLSDLASTVRVAPYITEDSTALVSRDEGIQNSTSSKETAVAEVVAQPSIVTGKVQLFCKISTCFADVVCLYSQSPLIFTCVKSLSVLDNFGTGLDSVLKLQLCQNSNNVFFK
jgi:hypothetical protein